MQLETLLTGLLDPDLAAQFQVAAARKNRLILISPSASWATRLRMQAPRLISSLHAAGLQHIEYIDIRVAPLVTLSTGTRSKRPLSAAAKQALGHMARFGRRIISKNRANVVDFGLVFSDERSAPRDLLQVGERGVGVGYGDGF